MIDCLWLFELPLGVTVLLTASPRVMVTSGYRRSTRSSAADFCEPAPVWMKSVTKDRSDSRVRRREDEYFLSLSLYIIVWNYKMCFILSLYRIDLKIRYNKIFDFPKDHCKAHHRWGCFMLADSMSLYKVPHHVCNVYIRTVCLAMVLCCGSIFVRVWAMQYHPTSFNRNKSSKTFSILQSDRGWYVTLSANVCFFFFSMQSSRVICRRSATEMCQFLYCSSRTSFRSKFKYNKLQFHAKVFWSFG